MNRSPGGDLFEAVRCLPTSVVPLLVCLVQFVVSANFCLGEESGFRVGAARRDITPPAGLPMWGYGARHDLAATGTLTPLFAKAIVLAAGDDKLAVVGLDLGRGPTAAMMAEIREAIRSQAGIEHVLISGSHTHHGPCIELLDRPGFGKGKYDQAVAFNQKLPQLIIEAILEADSNAQPARLGVTSKQLPLNRNRQMKREPKVTDSMLGVMRFDDEAGHPIGVLVNFAAHPVMTSPEVLEYSADYPGYLQAHVEANLQTTCVFMQGASGDLSPNPVDDFREVQAFGELLAQHVLELAAEIETTTPEKPSLQGSVEYFQFSSRVDFGNPLITLAYEQAFFPELIRCFVEELRGGVPAELNAVLLNKQIALVGGSGEFFCQHALRLKERASFDHTFFFGYCNGHSLYFPTIEAAAEGGYGADAPVSPVELGAGERMMDRALIHLYTMAGRFSLLKSLLGQ